MSETDLLTAEELAARLHVRPSTVREWARRRRIPAVRLSPKVVRFSLAAAVETLSRSMDSAARPETLVANMVTARRAEQETRRELQARGVNLCFANELESGKGVDHAE